MEDAFSSCANELRLWNPREHHGAPKRRKQKQKRKKKVTRWYTRASLDRLRAFLVKLCGLYFHRDNSLDYLIQSEYIYKTREVLVYHSLFFSSSKRNVVPPSFCFSVFHAHALHLSFSLSFSRSFIRYLSLALSSVRGIYTPTPLSVSLPSPPRARDETGNTSGNRMRDTLLLPRIDRVSTDEFATRDKIRRRNYRRRVSLPSVLIPNP